MSVAPAEPPPPPARPMHVAVFADPSCPWGFLAHLALHDALRTCADLPLLPTLEYRPFQLETPDALPAGAALAREELWAAHRAQPGAARRFAGCVERAQRYGVTMRLGAKVAQGQRAQRLLLLAHRRGGQAAQQALLHAILRSVHEDEACCDDLDMLARCAQAVEVMPADAARAFLKGDELRGDVEDLLREARELGITAVPMVVFGGKWAVGGAQSPDVYARVLRHLAACGCESVPISFPLYPAIA